MAAVFPYRGGCAPVPNPLAPLPDYMSEEKLQEKGGYGPGHPGSSAGDKA